MWTLGFVSDVTHLIVKTINNMNCCRVRFLILPRFLAFKQVKHVYKKCIYSIPFINKNTLF